MLSHTIRVQNVYLTLKSQVLIQSLSFDVSPGSRTCLLGLNGAGKSLTLRMIMGEIQPTSGDILVLEQPPGAPSTKPRIGFCPQETAFPESLTASEVLHLVRKHYAPLPSDSNRSQALLPWDGPPSWLNRRVANLSGGERRLLGLACVLAGQPELLILDEPTVALDVQARMIFWRAIKDFSALGGSVLFTTHILEEAQSESDHVLLLEKGTLRSQGSPDQIRATLGKSRARIRLRPGFPKRSDLDLDFEFENAVQLAALLGEMGPWIEEIEIRRPTLEEVLLS